MRTFVHSFAALTVACVFVSLPSLARIHDRVTAHDDVTRFRLSQNLERPHEKIDAAQLDAMPTFRIARDVSLPRILPDSHAPAVVDAVVPRLASRAPPVC